ncbi:MAG: helix-turn-helix domain-containing protein [Acidobacteriota bacterium]
MHGKLLTTTEAAHLCSVTPDTVLKWIRSGRLPARRTIGGHHRIHRADLEALIHPRDGTSRDATPSRRRVRYCWEHHGNGELLENCRKCAAYLMRAHRCYELAKVAPAAFHPKVFCNGGCESCSYFIEVQGQRANVLVITNDPDLTRELRSRIGEAGFNLEITDCEYSCSAILNRFRADYAIVDCNLGRQATADIVKHLMQDPRIPFVRIVLAGSAEERPGDCEMQVFARIERPWTFGDIVECIQGELSIGPGVTLAHG